MRAPTKTAPALFSLAATVAKATGGAFDVLAIGEGAKNAAAALSKFGARKVLTAEIGGGYFAEKYVGTIAEVAKKGYGVVTATASTYGKTAKRPHMQTRAEEHRP